MITTRRLAIYVIVFVILFAVFFATDIWKRLDYFVYERAYLEDSDSISLSPDISLIDVRHPKADDKNLADDVATTEFRKRLIGLLDSIAERVEQGEVPKVLVLDIYFANESFQREPLFNAIKRLTDKNVKVYAVFDTVNADDVTYEKRLSEHAQEIYGLFHGGLLHTSITRYGNVLSYMSDVEFGGGSGFSTQIVALPQQVALDIDTKREPPDAPRGYVLPLGNESRLDAQTYRFVHERDATSTGKIVTHIGADPASFTANGKILVVGSIAIDQPMGVTQAGPKIVAWALDDQLNRNENAKTPLDNPGLILGLLLFITLFTVAVFALLFKFVKTLQTKPMVLASIAFVIGVVMLGIIAKGFLALNLVTPVGLSLAAIFLAAILSWRYAYKFLVTGVIEGSGKYDVFISYSRKDGDWVVKNLYEPLKAMRKADGSELAIFFDRDEIGMGEAFTAKYMWAIVDSKFFIPVFSKNYYGKQSHGRNEMDLAYKRSVEKKVTMLLITHDFAVVPEIFDHLNFFDINEQPGFIDEIEANIVGDS